MLTKLLYSCWVLGRGVALAVKHNVGYIISHPSINVLQQPQSLVGMPKLA